MKIEAKSYGADKIQVKSYQYGKKIFPIDLFSSYVDTFDGAVLEYCRLHNIWGTFVKAPIGYNINPGWIYISTTNSKLSRF